LPHDWICQFEAFTTAHRVVAAHNRGTAEARFLPNSTPHVYLPATWRDCSRLVNPRRVDGCQHGRTHRLVKGGGTGWQPPGNSGRGRMDNDNAALLIVDSKFCPRPSGP
jgi:hypothetical protein